MPDEDNLRHWSHHYSTATVDYPVFRAAMRNYNNVSFMFGLEELCFCLLTNMKDHSNNGIHDAKEQTIENLQQSDNMSRDET